METEVVCEHFQIPLCGQGIIRLVFKKSKDTDELMSLRQRLTVTADLLLHLLKYLNQAMPVFVR